MNLPIRKFLCSGFLIFPIFLGVQSSPVAAQELISNGTFSSGLTGWTQSSWAGGSSFGTNANGPTSTAAASGNYAFAGGGTYNLLQQGISGVTNGGTYRLTFQAGSKSGQGSTFGVLSLFDGLAGNYNSASFNYNPSDAAFGTYTVDFTARGATDLWLRNDGGGYAAYDNVSVTSIGSVQNALNYSSASGFSEITSALSGSGKVTVNSGTGGLTLKAANTYSGGTEVTGGTLYVTGSGTLGATTGSVTVDNAILDLRNQQTRTGTMTIKNNGFILSGDGTGSLVNNGSAFEFQGGSIELPLSGTGGMNITGGGRITSSNSYTGATTISATPGWYGTGTFFLNNANGLGDAAASLTISGGTVSLANNTLTRSGNLTISGGRVHTGTISKSGSNYDIQGGQIDAVLAGAAGLTKSGAGNASLTATNTYLGGTTINAGTLSVYSAGGLGAAAGAVTVNSGGTLYTGGGLTISRTGDVTVNGGSLTTDNYNFGTISLSSGGNFIANNAAVLAVKLAGSGGLTVGGTGETYLWTDSSYTGATVINSGQLTLGGVGAISTNSTLQIASGAAVNLTGAYAANNIDRTFAGLTGGGILYGGGGTVTVNKASGLDTFTGDIQGAQGLVKSGAGDLALSGASSFTGTTTVNGGRLVVAHVSALGSTAGGTVVADGAQLMLTNVTVGNEALTISGSGLASGSLTAGALRSIGTNTYQGKITLGADARIFGGTGTSLTLDVASGEAVNLASHTLTIDGAGTTRINDAIVGTGGLTKIGNSTLTLAASNSYSGATAINAGRIALSGAGRLGSGAITISNASTGTLEFAVTGLNTMGNAISGSGALLSSSGTTELNGAVTSTGGLTVNSSTVRVGSSGSVSTASTVNNGGTLDVAGTAGNVQLNSGGTLKGSGTVSALTVASGGTLAPGNSPGTLTASSATWNGGGTYAWEINNFLGSAGTNWDFLNIAGGLTISASSGNKFIIDVISLLASNNTSGAASNFDAFSNYSFAIATAAGGVSGFDASYFNILTSNFANNMNPTGATAAGSWYLTQSGNSINLNYAAATATAIPEPSTGGLLVLGMGILALRRRFSVK